MLSKVWAKILGVSSSELEKEGEEVAIEEGKVSPQKLAVKDKKSKKKKIDSEKEDWFLEEEGRLTIDLYEKDDFLMVESAMAGVKSSDLEINIEPDILRIKGRRTKSTDKEKNYFYQECFWGNFSRTVVLPKPVKPEKAKALIDNGILTISLPKKEKGEEKLEVDNRQ